MVSEILGKGKENCLDMAFLALYLNMTEKELNTSIALERLAGAPILTYNDINHYGYYLADSFEEKKEFLRKSKDILPDDILKAKIEELIDYVHTSSDNEKDGGKTP